MNQTNLAHVNVIEEYMDVLMNIELCIYKQYTVGSNWHDNDVLKVLEALVFAYKRSISPSIPEGSNTNVKQLYQSLLETCQNLTQPTDENVIAITPEEVIICLKRIEKSVKHWNKRLGSQGYLKYISEHFSKIK